ncbi:fusolin [Choristoneura biennis entomopoxvirus]|uniref:Spindolin n=2 Tax=Choristoneura biennis entomopoxvirus TaxID=10288 RepID=SPIN_CBEPV|nr:fusolin [Choristoneura biennis entomopoxvirus]P23061.1 RecName: Full=Spindolin; AltName: Full=Spheroidin; AltName: Full=p50; Flags: Precursor [Choristoneura biennis entomopoxvirus]AAA42887.1 spheroidin precursor [Choristoneura biennis entomopoxvirus]CCU55869.1 fusolin [Choristoneura biennis entomopoxvirus]
MNKLILISLIASLYQVEVDAHGYMTFPIARQRRCSAAGGNWYPVGGGGIQDPMCRAAYQNVFNKVLNSNGGDVIDASEAANYMYTQDNEYAALAGPDYTNICHIQQRVVPSYLCAAGASDWSIRPFGDKSGMDLPGSWTPTIIQLSDNQQSNVVMELEFCPTAVHDPSYYEVYITNPSFNVYTDNVVWANLDLIYNNTVTLRPKLPESTCAANSMVYRFEVSIPVRPSQFVLYVRWQRIDPVGEGFYNCVDMKFKYSEGPDEEDIIEPEYEVDNEAECFAYRTNSGNVNVNPLQENKYMAYANKAIRNINTHSNGCSRNRNNKNNYNKYYSKTYNYNQNRK